MKLLDDKMRLFGVVNPVDILVVLALLAAAVVGYTLLTGKTVAPPSETGTVEVVLFAQGIPALEDEMISKGDVAARSGGTGKMGTVESFRVEPALKEATDASGTLVVYKSDIARDVYVTVRGPGALTPTGVNLGDERIRLNQVFDLQLPLFQMSARVISVRQVD